MVGAQHRRERIWILAYPAQMHSNGSDDNAGERLGRWPLSELGNDGRSVFMANASKVRQSRPGESIIPKRATPGENWEAIGAVSGGFRSIWSTEPDVGRVANGVPFRVDRLSALGNAVVPQIPELIGNAILQALRNEHP